MKKILFYSIIIASLLISQIIIAPNVYATGSWNSAAAHTAAVDKMEAAAADAAVAAAIAAVKSAEAAVAAAETAILTALANPTPANTAPLLAALAAAIVSLAKAKAILASAGTVVLGIGAFALGIFIGTSAYQAGWGIEDLCFDPVCPVTSSLTIIPDYQSVTETEIDLLIPEIIFETTGKKMIKEDFVSSEIGKVSWTYMSEGFGFFINTYRGAVAASEDKHTQVLNAVDDMNISLEAIPKIHLQVADILENTPVIPKDTLEELQTSSDELGVIIIELEELEFDNPELMELLKTSKLSIDESILEVSKLYDSHGDPRTLVGEEGLFPNLNRSDLQKFSQKCKDLGKECLPKSEIIIANMLLDATNVNDPKYDFPSELAKSDSRTFPNEENAIFSSSDSVTLAHILRASATTLSDSGKWLNVDLEESPLTIAARAALDDVELIVTITPSDVEGGTQVNLEFSTIHVNYEITAMQNGEEIFKETAHAMEMTGASHIIDAVGSDESPIDIKIVSLGIGLPGANQDWTGPTGTVASTQVVPEFGTIAMMILAVAIISIVAITKKSRIIPKFQ